MSDTRWWGLGLLALMAGCGASGHGDVVEGKEAVEKKQTAEVSKNDAKSDESGEKSGVECNEDTNDIGWCENDHTVVFCVGAEKKWYKVDCNALPSDEGEGDLVCGVRKGQTHVVCDAESKFE